jgi:hypothetical protein
LNITAQLGDISGQPKRHKSGGYLGYAEHWFVIRAYL